MGDTNPIRTLGDYSRPSHEGYMNTIELPEENNVVPLRSDTIRLMQNRCSFHELRSEDPNQHLKDFLKLVDSLDLDDLALYDNESWNNQRDFAKLVKAISLPQDSRQAFVDYASSCTNEAVVLSACSCPTEDPQCSTQIHSSINTITICPECPGKLQNSKPEEEEQEEKDNSENINTDPSLPPDPSISFINEKVYKLNSFFEIARMVPPHSKQHRIVFLHERGLR
ncbi:hypothetical protein Tco_0156853 [Tanacetum coccineum]